MKRDIEWKYLLGASDMVPNLPTDGTVWVQFSVAEIDYFRLQFEVGAQRCSTFVLLTDVVGRRRDDQLAGTVRKLRQQVTTIANKHSCSRAWVVAPEQSVGGLMRDWHRRSVRDPSGTMQGGQNGRQRRRWGTRLEGRSTR